MTSDTDQMVLQTLDSILDTMCHFARSDLVLIELLRAPEVSAAALAVAAQTVLSTLHAVDALSDRVHALSVEARRS